MTRQAGEVQDGVEQHLAWVKACRKGDTDAENALLAEFIPIITRQVISKIGPVSDDWKDLTNEICLTLLLNIRDGKFDPEKGQLPSYIFGITRFKIGKYIEAGKKNHELSESFDPQEREFVSRAVQEIEIVSEERQKKLYKLLKKLKRKHREVLEMRYLEGMRVKDIAVKLGYRSEQKVSNLISYALRQLRQFSKKTDYF